MKPVYFTFLITQFLVQTLICQPLSVLENQRAHKRYWYYRTRMINDFMKVGKEQGNCIVFAERNYDYSDGTEKGN